MYLYMQIIYVHVYVLTVCEKTISMCFFNSKRLGKQELICKEKKSLCYNATCMYSNYEFMCTYMHVQ